MASGAAYCLGKTEEPLCVLKCCLRKATENKQFQKYVYEKNVPIEYYIVETERQLVFLDYFIADFALLQVFILLLLQTH